MVDLSAVVYSVEDKFVPNSGPKTAEKTNFHSLFPFSFFSNDPVYRQSPKLQYIHIDKMAKLYLTNKTKTKTKTGDATNSNITLSPPNQSTFFSQSGRPDPRHCHDHINI